MKTLFKNGTIYDGSGRKPFKGDVLIEDDRIVEVAEKIRYMSEGIGISRMRAVVNKVPSPEVGEALEELLTAREIRRLGTLPLSGDVSLHALTGTPLSETDETYGRIRHMLELLLDENEMDHPFVR